jgi:hypothetical protein
LIVDWIGNNHLTLKGKRGNGVLFLKIMSPHLIEQQISWKMPKQITVMWLNVNLSKPT